MSRTSDPGNNPSQLPPPLEEQLEIVPKDPGKEVENERQIIDGLLDENGRLPWVWPSIRERGKA
ncbi:hypothetical protein JXD20_01645 [Candidatus Peregrinibacteria bacterium]|nr:hypothetical protein [Candidatus Peregrinibacteria bacterium]